MVEKCKFSNNKIIDVESTIKTTVLILDYQNYWNSAAAGWRWHNWNILRSNITNHVPTAGGAGGRGDQPDDAPPQQVKISFHSFEKSLFTCFKNISGAGSSSPSTAPTCPCPYWGWRVSSWRTRASTRANLRVSGHVATWSRDDDGITDIFCHLPSTGCTSQTSNILIVLS